MHFDELCRRSPELAELKRQAREAARESRTNWYGDWCSRSRAVADVARAVAVANGLGIRETLATVRDGLVDAYAVERRRERRRREKRPA
jgi:hypothetical protein